MNKLYDCVTFFQENLQMELRFFILNEVVFDFNDRLKSMTSGYASFDYEILGHREGDLVKLSILLFFNKFS